MGDSALVGGIYSEKNIADYIFNFLNKLGVAVEIVGSDPSHPIVVGKIDAKVDDTIILEAHMDTVSHLNMSIDPFDPVIKNGVLFGRGACDTKASLATYLYSIEYLLKNKVKLNKNIVFVAVHNEEYSFGGIKEFVKTGIKANLAIVGEPTKLNMIHAHKGVCRFWIKTIGKSSHAALPWLGLNAIYSMAEVISIIRKYEQKLKINKHDDLGYATINIGKIIGGLAVNIVPDECKIEIDRRLLPDEQDHSVIADLKKLVPESLNVHFSDPYISAPAIFTLKSNPACQLLKSACLKADVDSIFESAHYATDASYLSSVGIPSIVFGPGSIERAHTHNEYVEINQIEKASRIIINLLTH